MQKVVLDTNLWVDFFRYARHEDIVLRRGVVKYLSAVVLMELRAGVRSARDRKKLEQFTSVFRTANRILVPSAAVYEEAGLLLGRLRTEGREVTAMVNDVLIALSARAIGAIVVTQNRSDFLAIRKLRRFRLTLIGDGAQQGDEI